MKEREERLQSRAEATDWLVRYRQRAMHTAVLREALEYGNRRLGHWCDLHGAKPEDVAVLRAMQDALAAQEVKPNA